MESIVSYLIPAVAVLFVLAVVVLFVTSKKGSKGKKGKRPAKQKSQSQIIKEATKRLARNPHDPEGLVAVGNVYYTSHLWEKAYPVYDELTRIAKENANIDELTVIIRCGVCAIKLGKLNEGITALTPAFRMQPGNFDINFNLGVACYGLEQYDKAIPCFKKAITAKPDAEGVAFYLAESMYKAKHYKEGLPYFKKALDEDPTNKEALFCMADSMYQEGYGDKALKIFMHLRADPTYGSRSSLYAGLIHLKAKDLPNAINDFEIGLKHENIDPEIKIELQYNLAKTFLQDNKISEGLKLLKSIHSVNANYKDVNSLINTYQELSQNSNLQIYLFSNSSDFVALCRQFLSIKYSDSNVKIDNIDVDSLYIDIVAQINQRGYSESAIFRFFRTSGATGEMYVRDLHSHMQDLKVGRGFCITAGVFSDEAHKYIEGRPLDLIEKNELTKILKQIS